MEKVLILILIFFNVAASKAQTFEVIDKIEISRGNYDRFRQWKKDWTVTLVYNNGTIYIKKRNRLKEIENGDSLITLLNRGIIDSVLYSDKIHCDGVYNRGYQLVYFVSEKYRKIEYTYSFSAPVICSFPENWTYIKRIYDVANKLHAW